jgi:hypothetical protein
MLADEPLASQGTSQSVAAERLYAGSLTTYVARGSSEVMGGRSRSVNSVHRCASIVQRGAEAHDYRLRWRCPAWETGCDADGAKAPPLSTASHHCKRNDYR